MREAIRNIRRATLPIALAGVAIVLQLGGGPVVGALRYERVAVQGGQAWRLLTGNLVHLGWAHLTLNLAALAVIWTLFGRRLRGAEGWAAACCSGAAVGLGLLLSAPQVAWYVGLSGVLHGLLAHVALRALVARDAEGAWLLLLGAKLVAERTLGPNALSAAIAGGAVISQAHAFGAAGGVLSAATLSAWQRALARRRARL